MTDGGDAGVTFTNVLYGVVASNALVRLRFGLGLRNAALLFAFVVLATDWVEYRLDADAVPDDVDGRLVQFGLDVSILVVWSFLTVTPVDRMPAFVALLAALAFLQGLWDARLLDASLRDLLAGAEWQLAVLLTVVAAVGWATRIPPAPLLGATVIAFVGRKVPAWRGLYVEAKRGDRSLRI